MEIPLTQTRSTGGAADDPAALAQNSDQKLALELSNDTRPRRMKARRRADGIHLRENHLPNVSRQAGDGDLGGPRQDDSASHDVLELTNVSRVIVRIEKA